MFELEITEPRFAKELRSGFIFIIREGDRIACHGRIKDGGVLKFAEGSDPFPTKNIARAMAAMAKRYGETGEIPEDRTFASEEPEPAPEPVVAEDEEPAPAPKPKRRKTKTKKD